MPTTHDVRCRIEEVAATSARWLRQLDDFLPSSDSDARTHWGAPCRSAVEDKIVAECATFMHAVANATQVDRNETGSYRPALSELTDALAGCARPLRHQDMLRAAPQLVWPVAMAHAILTRHGIPDEAYDNLVRKCVETGWNRHIDRPIFRSLEMRWIDAVRRGVKPDSEAVLPLMPTFGLPSLVARREDAYALTHMLFYASDFGLYELPDILDPEAIARQLDAYLAWQLWENDLDLLSELLAAAFMCGVPSRYSVLVLQLVWPELSTGITRGPFYRETIPPASVSPTKYAFGSCYHTTLVTGILCASLSSNNPELIVNHNLRPIADEHSGVLRILGVNSSLAGWSCRVGSTLALPEVSRALMLDGALSFAFRRNAFEVVANLRKYASESCDQTFTMHAAEQAINIAMSR